MDESQKQRAEILDHARLHHINITEGAANEIAKRATGNLDDVISLFRIANNYARIRGYESITASVVLESLGEKTKKFASRRDLTGLSFERKCMELLISRGFEVLTTNRTSDGGIDLTATSFEPIIRGKYVIQCKDWSTPVGVHIVRDLYGVVHHEDANKGILITSSSFTDQAIKFATGKRLELINGIDFQEILKEAKNSAIG